MDRRRGPTEMGTRFETNDVKTSTNQSNIHFESRPRHGRQTNNKKWMYLWWLADQRNRHSRIHSTWLSSDWIRSHSSMIQNRRERFTIDATVLFAQNEKTKLDLMSCYESASVSMRVSFGLNWFRYFRRKSRGFYFRIIRNSLHRRHVPAARINLNFYHELNAAAQWRPI